MSVSFLKVTHGGSRNVVAVYPGISAYELSALLSQLFGLGDEDEILGVECDSGMYSLEDACEGGAELLQDEEYSLVLDDMGSHPYAAMTGAWGWSIHFCGVRWTSPRPIWSLSFFAGQDLSI
jgi:hypothetical protein